MSPDTAKRPWEGRIPQVRTNGLTNISTLSSYLHFLNKEGEEGDKRINFILDCQDLLK